MRDPTGLLQPGANARKRDYVAFLFEAKVADTTYSQAAVASCDKAKRRRKVPTPIVRRAARKQELNRKHYQRKGGARSAPLPRSTHPLHKTSLYRVRCERSIPALATLLKRQT